MGAKNCMRAEIIIVRGLDSCRYFQIGLSGDRSLTLSPELLSLLPVTDCGKTMSLLGVL